MKIDINRSAAEAGAKAAEMGAEIVRRAIAERGRANVVMATGMSQIDLLDALVNAANVDWSKVTGFHLDEYVGIAADHPASFRRYLKERFVDRLPQGIGAFYYVEGDADLTSEIDRLGQALDLNPIDLCFLGIGQNGHIAFNDPPADFGAARAFAVVELSEISRKQQFDQGWFGTMDEVPRQALSMTVPQILKSGNIVCIATGNGKAEVIAKAIRGSVTPDLPASVLQTHPDAAFVLDIESAKLLGQPELFMNRS